MVRTLLLALKNEKKHVNYRGKIKNYFCFVSGKVADHTSLLESRGHRLVTTSIAVPHAAQPVIPSTAASNNTNRRPSRSRGEQIFAMPGIKSFLSRRRNSGLEGPQSPLVARKENGASAAPVVRPASSLASLRKCETVLALTGYLRWVHRLLIYCCRLLKSLSFSISWSYFIMRMSSRHTPSTDLLIHLNKAA